MPNLQMLSDEDLISRAHQWRRSALYGASGAREHARACEGELRRRLASSNETQFQNSGVRPAQARVGSLMESAIPCLPAVAGNFLLATADASNDASAKALSELLANVRSLLKMDIAFVSEFVDGHRVFREVSSRRRRRRYCERPHRFLSTQAASVGIFSDDV